MKFDRHWTVSPAILATIASLLLPASMVLAQDIESMPNGLQAQSIIGSGSQSLKPLINLDRSVDSLDPQGLFNDETVNINVGIQVSPVNGLNFSADAWRLEVGDQPPGKSLPANTLQSRLPGIYLESDLGAAFNIDQRLQNSNVEANGVDLGASYIWNTDKLGQFTLSTKASYIYDMNQRGNIPDAVALINPEVLGLTTNADLQGSLTLTWQLGNHSASAVTNYFDSFKDIGELNLEEINELVDNITTFDLQYGYSVKTGKRDQAVISFDIGIRNIFDETTTQIINHNSRILDQNGRVAYGTIKYQF